MAKYKITIDKAKCIGCGACVSQCPDNFEMESGAEYKARVKKAEVTDLGCSKEAADICPVQAITIKKV
jgi:ferredoxin